MVGEVKSPLIKRASGEWEVVVGLEIHAQVISNSKLFSTASTQFTVDPNINITLFDIAFPGMLPVLNMECVRQAVRTGLGLNGRVMQKSVFDRKSYFYPDLPQGYQISQFFHPIVLGGYLDIAMMQGEQHTKRVNLERIHLEQDAGKSIHDLFAGSTAIDLNRAGIALMEIVTKPDMRSADEAMTFLKAMRLLLRHLGTCDANMEQGSLRADVNVSVRRVGEDLGTRVELKNINSIRFVGKAIEAESARQIDLIESGGKVQQQTCMFDANTGTIRPLRAKEDEIDYRYFPDPDLPPVYITQEFIDQEREKLPELPQAKAQRYQDDYGIGKYEAMTLVEDQAVSAFFEGVLCAIGDKPGAAREAAMWMIGEVFAAMSAHGVSLEDSKLTAEKLAELITSVLEQSISRPTSKEVFANLWASGESPLAYIERKGLKQVSDTAQLETWVREVLDAHPAEVDAYRNGKTKLQGFFIGQVMQKSGGRANPKIVGDAVRRMLATV